ncbi:MAG: DEAD/DEAH box helicase [Nanoarchaeota archaeon]
MKFNELNLDNNIVRAVNELGLNELTLIQEKSIPIIQSGRDLTAQSETGSGKTAAFGLPILNKVNHGMGIQCLVLVPTRELSEQVANDFNKFSKYKKLSIVKVYGGVSINPQISDLRTADIVIATPGRLLDHLNRRTINLNKVKFLVLDEADKMFEMGFIDDVKLIIEKIPRDRQTLLFSATLSSLIKDLKDLARKYMHNPENIKANVYVDKELLSQEYYDINTRDKFSLLLYLIKKENPDLCMVFCGTRHNTDTIARNLHKNEIEATAIHGGHSQNRRNLIMEKFHSGKLHVLVATDVAARGLDIKNVTHIFNYDIPKTSKEYIHRIGRTARAGKSGKAISILCEHDYDNFRKVLEDHSLKITKKEIPDFPRVQFFARNRENDRKRHFGQRRFGNSRHYSR